MIGDTAEICSTEEMSQLSEGSRLLVWTLRRLVVGQGACPLVAREFAAIYREDAGEVFATFGVFLCMLVYAGTHRLSVGYPGDSHLTQDERRIVDMVAVAQTENDTLFDAYVHRFARTSVQRELKLAVSGLAAAFLAHGVRLLRPSPRLTLIHGGGKGVKKGLGYAHPIGAQAPELPLRVV